MAAVACDTSPLRASIEEVVVEEGGRDEQLSLAVEEEISARETVSSTVRSACEVRGAWPGMVGAPLSPMPKRAKARIEEMREAAEGRSQRRHSIDSIEMRLREAEQRRQQFHEWMAERARPKRRVIVREDQESDDEKAQRILAKISAAQQKKSERIAAKQRRLAAVNERRTQRNCEASARAEREREELGSRVESRFLQAESNRQALIEAERARAAAANSRKLQKLERLRVRAEEKLARATQRLAAAEAKRNALLDAERSRASASFAQARRVAQTVVKERERETLERRQQIETKLLKARGRREVILGQRGGCSGVCHTHGRPLTRHGDRLSRKLTRCWRQFRRRKTTLELTQEFSTCNLSLSSVASLPFDVIAARITSAGTLRAVKAVLGRFESRLLAISTLSPAMSLEPLLRRLAKASAPPPRRAARSSSAPSSPAANGIAPPGISTPTQSATEAPRSAHGSGQCPAYTERYPTRVFLCAYMIIGHPDAVFSAKTNREEALAESAGRLLPHFEALLAAVLEGPSGTPCLSCPASPPSERDTSPLPGGAPPADKDPAASQRKPPLPAGTTSTRLPFSDQLGAFDSAWCEYLEQFVAWKVKDVRQMEDEMVRTACKLERSMLRRCGVLPSEDASHLGPDFQSMHKQVLVDQGLLQARIQRITGPEGVARMAKAIAELRSSFIESRASSTSPFPSAPSSPLPCPSPLARSPPSASALPPRALRRALSSPSTPPIIAYPSSMGSPPFTDTTTLCDTTTSEDETSPVRGGGGGGGPSSVTPPVRLVLPRQFRSRRSSAPEPFSPGSPAGSEYNTPPSSPPPGSIATSSLSPSPLAPAGVASSSPRKTPAGRSAFRFPTARGGATGGSSPGGTARTGGGKRKDPEESPSVSSPGASPLGGGRGFDAAALARALTSGAVQLSPMSSSRKVAGEVGGGAVASAASEAGLTNEKMVYELLHDRSWKLPEVKAGGDSIPKSDGYSAVPKPMPEALEPSPSVSKADLKVRMRTMMEAAYWDTLESSLAVEATVTAGASRVAAVVSEIRGELMEVAPSRMAKEITDSMDCELLEQILGSGSMDFAYMGKLLEYAHSLMLQLGAPARDEEARGAHQELLAELARAAADEGVPAGGAEGDGAAIAQRLRAKFARAVVQGLRFVFNRLKVLKRDVANARLSALAPVVQGHAGADYMRSAFSDRHSITLPTPHGSAELDGRELAEKLPGTATWLIQAARLEADAKDEVLSALTTAQESGAVEAATERLAVLDIATPRSATSGLPPSSAMRTGSRVVRSLPFSSRPSSSPASPSSSIARSPISSSPGRAREPVGNPRGAIAWGSPAAVVRAGLVAVVSSQDMNAATVAALPETLRLDGPRLHAIQDRFQKVAVTATGLLVARQVMSAKGIGGLAADEALISGRPRLSSLLDNDSVSVPKIGALLATIIAESAGPGAATRGGGSPASSSTGSAPGAQPSAEDLMVRLIGKALTPGDAIYTLVSAALSGALRAAVMLGGRSSPDATAVVDLFLRKAGAVALRDDILSVAESLEKVADVNLRLHGIFYRALR